MSYIGKDFINYGCGLHLDPELAWSKVHPSVRKNINKTKDVEDIIIERVSGTKEELEAMRSIWYFPNDPNYPTELGKDDIMYLAYKDNRLIGGTIMLAVGSHLFLNNLTANDEGKKLCMQDNILWYAVNDLKDSRFKYVDVGVSYRLNLYRFFKRWATFNYPVIFKSPKVRPTLSMYYQKRLPDVRDVVIDEEVIKSYLGNEYTIVPEVEYAIDICKGENLAKSQLSSLGYLFPLRFGAVIKNIIIDPKDMWDKYSCYDYYKVEYIKKVICWTHKQLQDNKKIFYNMFGGEDLQLHDNDEGKGWLICNSEEEARKLNELYSSFGIDNDINGTNLLLPLHAEVTYTDIEYMFAIYRGYLNLCSEWESTGVKGTLKE